MIDSNIPGPDKNTKGCKGHCPLEALCWPHQLKGLGFQTSSLYRQAKTLLQMRRLAEGKGKSRNKWPAFWRDKSIKLKN